MYCKFLSKALNGKIKCRHYKRYINIYVDCKKCTQAILMRNKGIKKVSKNKISVKKQIYQQVFERDKGMCRLRDGTCNGGLELHHIKYRSEAKDLINEPSNCIMLCNRHHRLVHSNKHLWQPILEEMVKSE